MKIPTRPRRIVFKFGTGVLSRPGGSSLDKAQFARIAREISDVASSGLRPLIVSSAAVAAGVAVLGLDRRPESLTAKQACAAVGQPDLMRHYAGAFGRCGLRVAQLLLTHADIDSRMRRHNARNTIDHLLESGVVPIINENDSVAVEELHFGDNDRLSSEVARLVRADRLVVLTSSDGLLDPRGRRMRVVRDIDRAMEFVRPDKGAFSVGGMATKLLAVKEAVAAGIPAAIIDGRKPGQICAAAAGRDAGTRFPAAVG